MIEGLAPTVDRSTKRRTGEILMLLSFLGVITGFITIITGSSSQSVDTLRLQAGAIIGGFIFFVLGAELYLRNRKQLHGGR
ncbi:MAG: hypothetical protein H8Z69_05275 [Nanohaloarchaea archaeon]|nr:hypothetical protein [Candidatus Nanohaloarchaea archaeon]